MPIRLFKLLILFWLLISAGLLSAQTTDQQTQAEQFLASLNFKQGKITLPGEFATLDLPDSFQYLGPEDAGRLLSEAWGNPTGIKTLGMLLPAGVSPLTGRAWGVVLTYQEDGHVSDSDADSIDYAALLKEMQEATASHNEARKGQGGVALTLVGWAENPTYDKASHKLFWAKELAAENEAEHTLNYDIRVLGRKGVLILTAVSGLSQLDNIKAQMQHVVSFTNFIPGNAYTDFNDSTDQVAAYGLAALVAGGAAAKLGLFAKLLALAVAFKKLIILAVVGLGVAIRKFFGRKQESNAVAIKRYPPEE